MKSIKLVGLFLGVLIGNTTIIAQGTMLLRQPAANEQYIVFCHADDIWRTDNHGGNAIRLTSALGSETNPRISPDGKWVAFSGFYYGNYDVYIVPIDGGEPKRLSWHPGNDLVQGWMPDGKSIYFSSSREGYPTAATRFYTVSLNGGTPLAMDLPFGASGTLSPDGQVMAFLPYQLWDPEWRNYRGGQAQPIWLYNTKTKETSQTIQGDRERHSSPVWHNGILYFLSERDYINNIWSYNPKTKVQKQISFYKDFDIKNLTVGGNKLFFEQAGTLHSYDINNTNIENLIIHVKADFNWNMPRWVNLTGANLINASLSPTGKRALFESRGEVFSVPKEAGDWRNLTNSSGEADRFPVWSPDGQKIAWFSDKSGEYQLMIGDQMGMEKPKAYRIPNNKFYYTPAWSPDGQQIAFTDTDYNIWYLNVKTGEVKKIDTDLMAHPNRTMKPAWSPDSKWIAYVKILPNQFKAVHLYNIESAKVHQLTDGSSDVIDPQWDENGKYLYFLASTDYALSTGWLDMSSFNYPVNRSLYVAVLNKNTPPPSELKSDEEPTLVVPDTSKKAAKVVPAANAKSVEVVIDFEDIQQRILPTNVPPRNFAALVAGPAGSVFCLESFLNLPENTIHKYTFHDKKLTTFIQSAASAATSFDRKSLLYRSGVSWFIVSTLMPPRPGDGRLQTDAMKTHVEPAKEAEQIFREGWRFQRDFLYVSNMHGAPWNDVYKWYAPWIKHVKHRTDLNYVVDIMGGEVSVGHSFTNGGDFPPVDKVPVGLLGADYEVVNGFYRIKRIFTGENWNPDLYAPLNVPNLGVGEGDYILEVNGQKLDASVNIYSLFEGTASRQVKLRINSKPDFEGSRLINVLAIPSEQPLRMRHWVEANKKRVDELSNGKLAYVYVPNTSFLGYTYFNRYYFSQQDKQGVVIDERDNGGGYAADYIIDILNRNLLGYFNSRVEGNRPFTTPMAGIWGPKVMIINGNAGSGGDLLPYMFKKRGIGPLVGARTWGGLVGTWDTPPFIDGGTMIAPRGGFFDSNGNWAIEADGVSPDIEVFQDPKSAAKGKDPQLESAVNEALKLLPSKAIELKKEPAAPIRYFRPKQ